MISSSLNDSRFVFQASKDGRKGMDLQQRMLANYVKGIIREYGQFKMGALCLHFEDLPSYEQKLFLAHMLHPSDYIDLTETHDREIAAIKEYADEMQGYINLNIDDVYHEFMSGAGFSE